MWCYGCCWRCGSCCWRRRGRNRSLALSRHRGDRQRGRRRRSRRAVWIGVDDGVRYVAACLHRARRCERARANERSFGRAGKSKNDPMYRHCTYTCTQVESKNATVYSGTCVSGVYLLLSQIRSVFSVSANPTLCIYHLGHTRGRVTEPEDTLGSST